jgi:hypothetical protein
MITTQNPQIAIVLRCAWGVESELASVGVHEAMYPIICTLLELGTIPVISEDTRKQVIGELGNLSGNILDEPGFDDYHALVNVIFLPHLNFTAKFPEVRNRIKLILAVVLRMIQIENQKIASA